MKKEESGAEILGTVDVLHAQQSASIKPSNENKNDDQNSDPGKVIIAVVLIFLGVLGGILYFGYRKSAAMSFEYNGFEITKVKNAYRIELYIQRGEQASEEPIYVRLRNDPRELVNITIDDGVRDSLLKKKQIYITLDPEENLTGKSVVAGLEIDVILDNGALYSIPTNSAFTRKNEKDVIVKTCEDVTEEEGVIWLHKSDNAQILLDENGCVILEGVTEDDIIRAADRLMYTVLGVLN